MIKGFSPGIMGAADVSGALPIAMIPEALRGRIGRLRDELGYPPPEG
jgi:hypothetical protein